MLPNPSAPEEELSPEILVPRLGDYLLEKKLVTSRELQQALDYQKKKTAGGQPRLLGRALMELGYIDRETLDKAIFTQVFSLHTALQESNRQLEARVQQRTKDLEKRLAQIHTTAKIAQIAIHAKNLNEMLKRCVEIIVEHMHLDHAAIFMLDETGRYAVLKAASGPIGQIQNLGDYRLPVGSASVIGWVTANNQSRVISDASQDPLFVKGDLFPAARSEAGIPLNLGGSLLGMLHVQHSSADAFDPDAVATMQIIANLLASLIQNQRLLETTQQNMKVMEKRVLILKTLDLVNQSISTETNLEKLFRITYEQVVTVMGEVDFLIALYDNDSDTIEIPYAFENGKRLTLPPFPLGEGLTSIIIHKKSPLMLVEDTIHKAADMGAKVVGMPAKSWLGAPMLVGGEAIGAMVVQDLENEKRFDEDDLHLMTNLATQVAITVRNVAQLENAQRQAERERVSAEITSKLWASTDIHTILRTAIQELGRRLEASEGMIQLQSPPSLENLGEPENGKKERAL